MDLDDSKERRSSIPEIKIEDFSDENETMESQEQEFIRDLDGGYRSRKVFVSKKPNHHQTLFDKRKSSLPPRKLFNPDQLLLVETEKRKRSLPPNIQMYTNAARRIHHTISTVASGTQLSPNKALHIILEEVNKNDKLNAEDLIQKLQIKCDVIKRNSGEGNKLFESREFDNEEETDSNLESDSFGGSAVSKIAQYLAFGSMDLNDFEKLIVNFEIKNKMESSVDFILTQLQESWSYCFENLVPLKQIHTMILVGIFHVLFSEHILRWIPCLIVYLSFIIMIYSTLKLLHNRHSVKNLITWKRLLSIFSKYDNLYNPGPMKESSDTILTEDSSHVDVQDLYSYPSLEPYGTFATALAVFIFSFSLSNYTVPNVLSMCIMSTTLSVLCTVTLPDKFSKTTVFIYFLCFIICISQINPLATFVLFKATFSAVVFGFLKIHINFQSICFVTFLIGFISLLIFSPTNAKYNFNRFILPHLICFFWWQTATDLVKYSNFKQIGYFNFLLTISLIWLALFPATGALAVVVCTVLSQFIDEFNFVNFIKFGITLTILFLPVLYEKWTPIVHLKELFRRRKRFLLLFTVLLLVIISIAFVHHGSHNLSTEPTMKLTWSEFEKRCGRCEECIESQIKRRILCSELKGTVVSWIGTVYSMNIVHIENVLESIFSNCPQIVAEWLRCFYGRNIKTFEQISDHHTSRHCSMSDYNVYSFTIDVIGPWEENIGANTNNLTLVLTAFDIFKDVLFELVEGDVISFAATFDDYYLDNTLHLRLLSINCVHCKNIANSTLDSPPEMIYIGFWNKLIKSFQYLFNFTFSPLLRL